MNNQEAKLILQAYRPNGLDASEPFFTEALEQARQDPELQKWFTDEMALNTCLQNRLETAIPVPQGLKSGLLALRKTVRPTPWWFQPANLALAAAILLMAALALFLLPSQKGTNIVSFRETMARQSQQTEEHVVFQSHDLAKIDQWLQGSGMSTDFNLPATLQGGTPQGCRLVDWNGHKATMICFFVGKEHMDLFVMDRSGLPSFPGNGTPQFAGANGLMTAMWANGNKVYLLTGGNKELLQKILQPT
jgi:hypothetical protein